jgi:myo-inositol-1(or 4)-monophosphatase
MYFHYSQIHHNRTSDIETKHCVSGGYSVTVLKIAKTAIKSAKKCVLANIDRATEYSGSTNPYGDQTLVLDMVAEEEIISVIRSSGLEFAILTEEKGFLKSKGAPEYLALIDPIDGSTNLKRGIPLVSMGITILPFKENMTSDDAEISLIESIYTDEQYVAIKGEGVKKNGKRVSTSKPVNLADAIISYDTKKTWDSKFLEKSLRTMSSVHDIRRSASNLLDLCWTASGQLDAMVDMRNMLPIIHISGIHMVVEAGGFVINPNGERFCSSLNPDVMMNFIAASNEQLARQILDVFNGSKK